MKSGVFKRNNQQNVKLSKRMRKTLEGFETLPKFIKHQANARAKIVDRDFYAKPQPSFIQAQMPAIL